MLSLLLGPRGVVATILVALAADVVGKTVGDPIVVGRNGGVLRCGLFKDGTNLDGDGAERFEFRLLLRGRLIHDAHASDSLWTAF
jgi:hypothetical protein